MTKFDYQEVGTAEPKAANKRKHGGTFSYFFFFVFLRSALPRTCVVHRSPCIADLGNTVRVSHRSLTAGGERSTRSRTMARENRGCCRGQGGLSLLFLLPNLLPRISHDDYLIDSYHGSWAARLGSTMQQQAKVRIEQERSTCA